MSKKLSKKDQTNVFLPYLIIQVYFMTHVRYKTNIYLTRSPIHHIQLENKTICKNVLCNLFWQFCKFLFQSNYFKTSDSEYNAKLIVKRNLQNKIIQPIALGVKHFIWPERARAGKFLARLIPLYCTGVNNIFNHQGHH